MNIFSLRKPASGVQVLLLVLLVVTMLDMDKATRLMDKGMHSLKTLTCMVMEPMLVIPTTNNQQRHRSHRHRNR